MLRQRIMASLSALALASVLAVVLPMSSASAANCATAVELLGGLHRRRDRLLQRPQLVRQVVDPERGARHRPTSGRTRACAAAGGAAARRTAGLQLPGLGRPANYVTGDIVKYTDGRYYVAEHDNPGYDPTISTWYWEPYTCGGTTAATNPTNPPSTGFVVSEAQFNQMFPSRNSFYTYSRPDRGAERLPRLREHRQRHRPAAGGGGVPRQRQPRDRRPGLHRRAEHRQLPALLRHQPAVRLPGRPVCLLRSRADPAQLELQLQGRR